MKALVLFIFPLFTFSQVEFSGKIVNKKTKEKIAFVTIGLQSENIGTNANENGEFKLVASKKNQTDTLIFTCIGFETLRLSINDITPVIELIEKQVALNEVTVNTKKNWKSSVLDLSFNCGKSCFTSNGFQTQVAKLFTSPTEGSMLSEIIICRHNHLFESKKTIFRLRIYNIDSITKMPSTDLTNEAIEVSSSKKNIKINLEQYKIKIPKKQFFIAVEWLKIPYNIVKYNLKVDGKTKEHINYKPCIGFNPKSITSDIKYELGNNIEFCGLSYQNIWFPILSFDNLSINAIVKH